MVAAGPVWILSPAGLLPAVVVAVFVVPNRRQYKRTHTVRHNKSDQTSVTGTFVE